MAAAVVILDHLAAVQSERDSKPFLEEETMTTPRKRIAGEGAEAVDYESEATRDLAIQAIKATMGLAQEVGRLATVITAMEEKLHTEYQTKASAELATLRARDKWFKRLVTAVVTAVAIAETMHWLGLGGHHG